MYVDQCSACHQDNVLTPGRDKIIIYIDQPKYCWIRMICRCGCRTRIYLNNPTKIVEVADFLHNLVLIDFVPDEVREGFYRANSRQLSVEEEAAILTLEEEFNA